MIDAPNIASPTLEDAVIQKIQEGLKETLPWLDHAYGKAERIVKQINGKDLKLPAVYVGNSGAPNDYLELSPDAHIGNFSFFLMLDPQKYTWRPKIRGSFKSPFALIFWFDLRKIYGASDIRNIDAVEKQVLRALNGGFPLTIGSIKVNTIYRLAENVYREFDLREVDNQFLMHPYAGFRLEGELIFEEPC